jgi:peptide-methionine (R)-S-oxide reductase
MKVRHLWLVVLTILPWLPGEPDALAQERKRPQQSTPTAKKGSATSSSSSTTTTTDENAEPPARMILSDAEWAKRLTHAQFAVTRRKETEPAFSGKLLTNHARGTYQCVCCGAPLFSWKAKFESGTGWPSFWAPIRDDALAAQMDFHGPEPRMEVMCGRCDAHLGHVFSDGPPPTGLRYCMNSVALKFVKETKTPVKPPAKKKGTAKSPVSAKGAVQGGEGQTKNEGSAQAKDGE